MGKDQNEKPMRYFIALVQRDFKTAIKVVYVPGRNKKEAYDSIQKDDKYWDSDVIIVDQASKEKRVLIDKLHQKP